ncbi:MAG: STAS/SEC14 domain-containing protein [Piscirickettsiaceae bacterium]|nr:STAS/SEC14 domain-containing protein [Piscirickettsiaceae bacterium]
MAIDWVYEDGLVIFNVSGRLTKPELDACQAEAEPTIQQGQAKILNIVTNFAGWDDNSGDWGDLSFGERNDQYIQKMATVGDEKWRDQADMFTLKVLRKFPIKYFIEGQEELARAWLLSD